MGSRSVGRLTSTKGIPLNPNTCLTLLACASALAWTATAAEPDGRPSQTSPSSSTSPTPPAAEDKITGTASLGVASQYIFRGYEVGKESAVIQPSVSLAYMGFAATFFGNIDTQEHATHYFTPDHPDETSFNEADLSLNYTHGFGKLSLTGGFWYYGTRYTDETVELFASATYDMIGKPTLAVYRDIDSYPATYINLSLAHSVVLHKAITADFGLSAGYLAGDSDAYRTSGGTGPVYSAFHDGSVKAGLTIPLSAKVIVQPTFQYWFPLSEKASQAGYNPFGQLDGSFVGGIVATVSF
jgi:hypothetical protein